MATAKFIINSSPSADRGFDATAGQTLTLRLEQVIPGETWHVKFYVYVPGDPTTPFASKDAPVLTLNPASGEPAIADGTVTVQMPASGCHSYGVRCVINGGIDWATGQVVPEWTSSRIVAIRSASGAGARKILPGESTEYSARGWADEINKMLDLGIGSGEGPVGPKGDKGDKGATGDPGPIGATGPAAVYLAQVRVQTTVFDSATSQTTATQLGGAVVLEVGNRVLVTGHTVASGIDGVYVVSARSGDTAMLAKAVDDPGATTGQRVPVAADSSLWEHSSSGWTNIVGPRGPAGIPGPTGVGETGAPGANAFTRVTASFVQPPLQLPVTVEVGDGSWMAIGQIVYIHGAGHYGVLSHSATSVTLYQGAEYWQEMLAGETVSAGLEVVPSGMIGPQGPQGEHAYTSTTSGFTQPAVGGTVTLHLNSVSAINQGMMVFVGMAGYFVIGTVWADTKTAQATLQEKGLVAAPGTVLPASLRVVPCGYHGMDTTLSGAGSPQGVVAASPGALYRNTNGGAGQTLWVKETGTGTSGWAAK